METATEFGTLGCGHAELPHPQGANGLTGFDALAPADTMVFRGFHEDENDASDDEDASDESTADALVAKAQQGDRPALEELLRSVRRRALAAALRVLHDRDDAEDAVQEAMLKVWRCLASFERRSSLTTWIHRIVTNASLDLLRRRASRPDYVAKAESPDEKSPAAVEACDETPETSLIDLETRLLVRKAIAALPSSHRQTVELRELEGYSYQEISQVVACPIGTVMSRLHHARHRLLLDLGGSLQESGQRFAA